jgi:hypothetical protein
LGFSGVFAQHPSIVLSTFSLFDFAKQMVDVSQPRKGVAFSTRSSARRVGDSPFLFCQAFFFVAILPKKKALQRRTIF